MLTLSITRAQSRIFIKHAILRDQFLSMKKNLLVLSV